MTASIIIGGVVALYIAVALGPGVVNLIRTGKFQWKGDPRDKDSGYTNGGR